MRRLIVLAFVWSSLGACGFTDDDSGSGYVAITDVATYYKQSYCTYLANCGVFPDRDTCLAANVTITITDQYEALLGAVSSGKVVYNGSAVKECFDALAKQTCDKTDQDGRVTPMACREFVRGTVDSGGACAVDEECISQVCNVSQNCGQACCQGTCIGSVAPSVALRELGEQCNSVTAICDVNLYCDTTATDTCQALKSDGMMCSQNNECAYGLACSGLSTARTCKALPGVGEPCPEGACRDDGLVCTGVTLTCVQVGLPPKTCTSSTQCSQYYPCDFTSGQCKQAPGVGQTCGTGTMRCFDANTFCDTNTNLCTATRAQGEPCSTDTECASGNCDQQTTFTCVEPPVCF